MTTTELETDAGTVRLTMTNDVCDVRAAWDVLERDCAQNVYATVGFVEPWARWVAPSLGIHPRYVLAEREGRPLALIPLGLWREAGIPMLRALSDTHTNMNGGLFVDGWDCDPTELQRALLELEPQAEALWLTNVPLAGPTHPLVALLRPSVHDIHGGTFDGGFEGHLSRNGGKRKRKKHRASARHFDMAGGWVVRRLDQADEAERMLDEARSMLSTRFDGEGIHDPFAAMQVRDFMTEMVRASAGAERPAMALWTLEVGDELIAIQAGGGSTENFSLMFTVYQRGPLDTAAPGDFLLYEVIKAAAEAGYASFDLGRGREPYKTSWCDVTIPLHDVRAARTARAKLWMSGHAGLAALKKRVRENERLWTLAKDVRRRLPIG